MKVLYVIYAVSPQSGGGHYHTLITLVKTLRGLIDFKILNVGLVHTKTLQQNVDSDYIATSKLTYLSRIGAINRYIDNYKPDVIHAFDFHSLLVARTASLRYKIPIVYSKCGGVNGSGFIPDADAYICFSAENKKHFEGHKNNDVPINHLPNRSIRVKTDFERVALLTEKYNLRGKKLIIRISRFHDYYHNSFVQSINLLKLLLKSQPNYTLLLIGIIQIEEEVEALKKIIGDLPVLLIHEPLFTKNAAELLAAADIVVATGRGTMEAASQAKVIFSPLKNSELPAPLTSQNLDTIMWYNFSERVEGVETSENIISEFLECGLEEIGRNNFEIFNKYFNIEGVIDSYLAIYNKKYDNMISNKLSKNYFGHLLRFLKPSFL